MALHERGHGTVVGLPCLHHVKSRALTASRARRRSNVFAFLTISTNDINVKRVIPPHWQSFYLSRIHSRVDAAFMAGLMFKVAGRRCKDWTVATMPCATWLMSSRVLNRPRPKRREA